MNWILPSIFKTLLVRVFVCISKLCLIPPGDNRSLVSCWKTDNMVSQWFFGLESTDMDDGFRVGSIQYTRIKDSFCYRFLMLMDCWRNAFQNVEVFKRFGCCRSFNSAGIVWFLPGGVHCLNSHVCHLILIKVCQIAVNDRAPRFCANVSILKLAWTMSLCVWKFIITPSL